MKRIRRGKYRLLITLLALVVSSSAVSSSGESHHGSGFKKCSRNSDPRYDRKAMLEKFDSTLKSSIPAYANFPLRGFFIYDLSDPKNKYIPSEYVKADECVDFINHHVYHFAPIDLIFAESHIAVLEDGEMKVFKAINCKDNPETVSDVVKYVNERLKKTSSREKLLTRLSDYRKYGFYFNIDSPRTPCEVRGRLPRPNS